LAGELFDVWSDLKTSKPRRRLNRDESVLMTLLESGRCAITK
jgi:hypothetical protein